MEYAILPYSKVRALEMIGKPLQLILSKY